MCFTGEAISLIWGVPGNQALAEDTTSFAKSAPINL